MNDSAAGLADPLPVPVYTLTKARSQIVRLVETQGLKVRPDEVRDVEAEVHADLAVPLFRAAKDAGADPVALARELASKLDLSHTLFRQVEAAQGYLNFRFNPVRFARSVVRDFQIEPEGYGKSTLGQGKTIVIDYSSPNIAKPFSVGHLRSTVIGHSLHRILSWLGYFLVGDNHLGDWGTQFGKLLEAWEIWGREELFKEHPTRYLLDLYVRFHEEAKVNPALDDRARDWFRRLENKDQAATRVWRRFVELSSAEFQRIYDLLGVEFDSTLGESFYADRLEPLVRHALDRGVAKREHPLEPAGNGEDDVARDERVVLIPLDSAGIDTPLILQKSDGTSLYATREIATAEYRIENWNPEQILYVVGNEQTFYFRQFNAALRLLGRRTPCVHVSFGLVRLPEGRMSTREGRVVFLEDVIIEAVRRARRIVEDRDMPDDEKEELARIVGIGAIKYADLSQSRVKEVVFDWDKMLALDGDSAPYLQYAHTRCRSILNKAGKPALKSRPDPGLLIHPDEVELLRQIARFPEAVLAAGTNHEPHRIAGRLYKLSQSFSSFYNNVPVLKADSQDLLRTRLYLVEMTGATLRNGLWLLGIEVPDRM